MATIHINNRSDFQILLKAEEGKTFPEFDFTLAFQTTGGFRYNVMSNDSKRFTPNADRTQAVITFDFANGDYFPNGRLAYTIKAEIQNSMFADGYENTQTPRLLDVIIWDGASDYSDAVEVDFVLPYVSVQAKSISPALLGTSNIIRKRLPYGAMAYQLYYTQLIRVPNALAAQEKFDDKVPQWFSEFLKRLAKTVKPQNVLVLVSVVTDIAAGVPSCPNFAIGEILVHYDEEKGTYYYDTTITPIEDAQVPEHYYYETMFFQVPYGVYYFDDNRALHRYCDEENYRPVERELPAEGILPSYQTNSRGTLMLYDKSNKFEHECYVRRRKNSSKGISDRPKRWYFYWRKTNLLRSLNNSPIKGNRSNIAYVRVRRCSSRTELRTNRWWSKWQYFNVSVGGGHWCVTPARER